jgi:hypothetical protein
MTDEKQTNPDELAQRVVGLHSVHRTFRMAVKAASDYRRQAGDPEPTIEGADGRQVGVRFVLQAMQDNKTKLPSDAANAAFDALNVLDYGAAGDIPATYGEAARRLRISLERAIAMDPSKAADKFELIHYLEMERSRLIRVIGQEGPPGRDILVELAAVQTCLVAVRENIEWEQQNLTTVFEWKAVWRRDDEEAEDEGKATS